MSGRPRKANTPKLVVDSTDTITPADDGRVRLSIKAPDPETLIRQLLAGDADIQMHAARELGVQFKDSPAVAALSALVAVLRNADSLLRPVLTRAIQAIAGKKYLDESFKKINNNEHQDQPPASPKPVPPKLEHVKVIFTDLPDGYDSFASEVDAINQAYRRELAERMTPLLKAKIQEMPSTNFDDKRDIVHKINKELKRFVLAIKHPKTGRAATLRTDAGNDGEGRFRLESESNDGKKESFTTPHLSRFLDHFVLMDAPPRREGLAADWPGRAGGPRGGPGLG